MKLIVPLVLICVAINLMVGCLFVLMTYRDNMTILVKNFEECVAVGYPVMESFPEQCKTPDGRNFVKQTIGDQKETIKESIGCYISGCSNEICGDEEGIESGCPAELKYACYKHALCVRQVNGRCGWTKTPQFNSCIAAGSSNNDNSGYVCALLCTGAEPTDLGCGQQYTKTQCDSVQSNKFPYKCEWKRQDDQCPPLP